MPLEQEKDVFTTRARAEVKRLGISEHYRWPGNVCELQNVIELRPGRKYNYALGRYRLRIDGPSGAGRALNLHPSTLRSRIKKAGTRHRAAGPL